MVPISRCSISVNSTPSFSDHKISLSFVVVFCYSSPGNIIILFATIPFTHCGGSTT